jgi:hypothetical protein
MTSPPDQLRRRLAFLRAAGWPFERAWRRGLYSTMSTQGLPRIRWGNGDDRLAWIEAFEATREEWRRAFEQEPSALTRPILVMAGDIAEDLGGFGVIAA